MDYESDSNAFAVRSGEAWVLKPICARPEPPANAAAIRAGPDWVLTSLVRAEAPANVVAVRDASGEFVLLPISCGAEDDPVGDEPSPYCDLCQQSDGLRSSYTVSISGFPGICTTEVFNGVWTVSWLSNCVWQLDIDQWHRLSLINVGGAWMVKWEIDASGGVYGWFLGSGGIACQPESFTWTHDFCFNPTEYYPPPLGCGGLCASVQSGGAVSVS